MSRKDSDTLGFLFESGIMMAPPFATTIFCILMTQKVRCMELMWPKSLVRFEQQRFWIQSAMRILICFFGYFFVWFPFIRLLVCFCECFMEMDPHFQKYYFLPTILMTGGLILLHGYFQSKNGKTANVSHNRRSTSTWPLLPDPNGDFVNRIIGRHLYWSPPDE